MVELTELLKLGAGVSGQPNVTRCKCLILLTGGQINDPAKGVDQFRLDLCDIVSQAVKGRILRPARTEGGRASRRCHP